MMRRHKLFICWLAVFAGWLLTNLAINLPRGTLIIGSLSIRPFSIFVDAALIATTITLAAAFLTVKEVWSDEVGMNDWNDCSAISLFIMEFLLMAIFGLLLGALTTISLYAGENPSTELLLNGLLVLVLLVMRGRTGEADCTWPGGVLGLTISWTVAMGSSITLLFCLAIFVLRTIGWLLYLTVRQDERDPATNHYPLVAGFKWVGHVIEGEFGHADTSGQESELPQTPIALANEEELEFISVATGQLIAADGQLQDTKFIA